jgi:hypothetical protein
MSFASWKKTNKVMLASLPEKYWVDGYRVAQAAYKAGERDATKRVEAIAKAAIVLRENADPWPNPKYTIRPYLDA